MSNLKNFGNELDRSSVSQKRTVLIRSNFAWKSSELNVWQNFGISFFSAPTQLHYPAAGVHTQIFNNAGADATKTGSLFPVVKISRTASTCKSLRTTTLRFHLQIRGDGRCQRFWDRKTFCRTFVNTSLDSFIEFVPGDWLLKSGFLRILITINTTKKIVK
jgi:hypothetical protein